MEFKEAASRFAELTSWIRELSSPQMTEAETADTYREKLIVNFRRIGELAQINQQLLNEHFIPLLESSRLLTDEEISVLQELKGEMLDPYKAENLDISFLYQITRRLYEDAERKGDTEALLMAMDDHVMASYALLTVVRRIYPYCDYAVSCREDGLRAANYILKYLPPEKLAELPEGPVRDTILINSRYILALYEYPLTSDDRKLTDEILDMLERALALADSPEYRKLAPDFDWTYHRFRTLHYFAILTVFQNEYGFNREQLSRINTRANALMDSWEEHKEQFEELTTSETVEFSVYRCRYLAGEIGRETYKEKLRALAENTREGVFNANEMQLSICVPIEYILLLDPKDISREDAETLAKYYSKLIKYIQEMPKKGHMSFVLTELMILLDHFIDVEGGIDFETMCMELLAALHPPTYVHSMSVADISACLAKHLFRKHPEMFGKTPGYPDADAVMKYVWHAAACHDVGKLFIIETIITYGRPLYEHETEWIRAHTEAGADLLSRHDKTKEYAEAALGHQRWYDGKGGYPESYHPEEAKNRLIVDIVACADCMDAATDSVGRSYKQGKTLEEFVAESKEGCGSRYAPFLIELLEDEDVYDELQAILSRGRDEKYRHTFTTLDKFLDR